MAQPKQLSAKRVKVDKAKARIVAITGGAAFLVMFFLVASYALFNQFTYQNRVIGLKKEAVSQLKDNLEARDSLVVSYKAFAGTPVNLIGGNADGSGAKDGSNAKLVLDALPSKYDFPALTASLEKLLVDHKGKIQTIAGTDEEVEQAEAEADEEASPVEMPFEISVQGTYDDLQGIVGAMERSIRPFQFNMMQVSGDQQNLTLTLTATTYYQPEKALNIKMETVK